MDIKILIGKRVKELRNGLGISQEELADIAGLDRTYGIINAKINKNLTEKTELEIKELNVTYIENIKTVVLDTFSKEPWNDDWSDKEQFHSYILDLIGNPNSLSLGLYENGELIGVSLGRIKHWYTGNEYWIDDLAILPQTQGRGCGSKFIDLIEDYISAKDFVGIVLFTEREIPAYHLYIKKGFEEKRERVFFEKKIL